RAGARCPAVAGNAPANRRRRAARGGRGAAPAGAGGTRDGRARRQSRIGRGHWPAAAASARSTGALPGLDSQRALGHSRVEPGGHGRARRARGHGGARAQRPAPAVPEPALPSDARRLGGARPRRGRQDAHGALALHRRPVVQRARFAAPCEESGVRRLVGRAQRAAAAQRREGVPASRRRAPDVPLHDARGEGRSERHAVSDHVSARPRDRHAVETRVTAGLRPAIIRTDDGRATAGGLNRRVRGRAGRAQAEAAEAAGAPPNGLSSRLRPYTTGTGTPRSRRWTTISPRWWQKADPGAVEDRIMRPSSTGDSERPIGYWLKAADEAITACVDAVHRAEGITRRDWQVLNTIFEAGRLSPDRILDTLRMFLDRGGLDAVLDALRSRGWIHEEADGEVGLTETGRQAHARI